MAGVSAGFAVFILWPFTQTELKSDQFIKDHARIVRPIEDFRWTDNGGESWGHLNISITASHVTNALRNHHAVEDVTRYIPQPFFWNHKTPGLQPELIAALEQPNQLVTYVKIDKAICADQNFFDFFDLPFIHGDPKTALDHAHAVVLSQNASQS